MPTYLVTLSLGPVQSLIEAARRTRDLWCGSWLLSEASKAVALAMHTKYPGSLVFPFTENPEADLAPEDEPRDKDTANVSNIVRALVEVPSEGEVRDLCSDAMKAAEKRLSDLCESARAKDPVRHLPLRKDLWAAQVKDILECYAAWAVKAPEEDYGAASERLGETLGARKATRNFVPAARGPDATEPGYGIPKSSLDAARESVIALKGKEREKPEYRTALRILGLSPGEQLDVLGFAKRAAAKAEQFTAYSRVAADTWIDSLSEEQRASLGAAYEPLVGDGGLATRVKGNRNAYRAFAYDAQLLYRFRLDNALDRERSTPQERGHLHELRGLMDAIAAKDTADGKRIGFPVPYAAILKADGDRMGKLLKQARKADQARAISKALSGFADSVRGTVRKHGGHAIYSGGDDVLALLPLQKAVPAAKELAQDFAKAMKPIAKDLGVDEAEYPSLSVGIGIGHVMEPLGALRARADAAEKAAKGNDLAENRQRNALAIQLGIRSGGEYCWRAQWTDTPALKDLDELCRAYRERKLPSRVAYDLRDIALRLKWLDDWEKPGGKVDSTRQATATDMRVAELRRMLDRARTDGGSDTVGKELKALLARRIGSDGDTLDTLADTLILARWLAASTAADVGETDE